MTKEDDEEKQVRGQDDRVMIPKLGKISTAGEIELEDYKGGRKGHTGTSQSGIL